MDVVNGATADVSGGAADDFEFTVQANSMGTVLGFSLTANPITAGVSVLTVITLSAPVDSNEICLVDLVLSDPAGLAVPANVICGGTGLEADTVYTVEPVTDGGILRVLLQSEVAISEYQFDLFELDGTPVNILAASGGLSGRVCWGSSRGSPAGMEMRWERVRIEN